MMEIFQDMIVFRMRRCFKGNNREWDAADETAQETLTIIRKMIGMKVNSRRKLR